MTSQLEALRRHTTIVADTGDFETIRSLQPTEATTNPSLILKAVQKEEYRPLLEQVVRDHRNDTLAELLDRLLVAFGREILNIVPGRVSTEVDARLSFDTRATVERARRLIALYEAAEIERRALFIGQRLSEQPVHFTLGPSRHSCAELLERVNGRQQYALAPQFIHRGASEHDPLNRLHSDGQQKLG